MVEFLPFLLILIGWDAASPGETMVLSHRLHPTQELCEAEAAKVREEWRESAALASANYRAFCVPAPTAEEYDRAFGRVK